MGLSLQFSSVGQLLLSLLVIVLVVARRWCYEAVHGLFFWLFTRSGPVFRLRLLYASAGAPEWYLPCRQHMVVGVAPLVVITVLGIIVLAVAPFGLLYPPSSSLPERRQVSEGPDHRRLAAGQAEDLSGQRPRQQDHSTAPNVTGGAGPCSTPRRLPGRGAGARPVR